MTAVLWALAALLMLAALATNPDKHRRLAAVQLVAALALALAAVVAATR